MFVFTMFSPLLGRIEPTIVSSLSSAVSRTAPRAGPSGAPGIGGGGGTTTSGRKESRPMVNVQKYNAYVSSMGHFTHLTSRMAKTGQVHAELLRQEPEKTSCTWPSEDESGAGYRVGHGIPTGTLFVKMSNVAQSCFFFGTPCL